MALARTRSVTLVGVAGHVVEVEADIGVGVPGTVLVGLPDAAVCEARDRVRAAIVNSGRDWPQRKITLGLSPASLPKRGSSFDLALAVAILAAAGVVPADRVADAVLLGELGLDGRVRGVRGVLPSVLAAVDAGHDLVIVPSPNGAEAALVPGVTVVAVAHLRHLVAFLRGEIGEDELAELAADARDVHSVQPRNPEGRELPVRTSGGTEGTTGDALGGDLADVRGQGEARYAVEVSAAGGHHLLLHGAPGTGKSMLAMRLPGLLPRLSRSDALEVTAIHSVAGTLAGDTPLMEHAPFQDPHHTATVPAVLGGGTSAVRPGAVSLAHRGVLLLDEAPEFATPVLEGLRQPMERGSIVVARAGASIRFPARFQLVLTANPCPCGLGTGGGADCRCTPMQRRRYASRLSGPVLDRVDIRQAVVAPSRAALATDVPEGSAAVRARVTEARDRQRRRFAGTPWTCNGDIPGPLLRKEFPPDVAALALVEEQLRRGALTGRGADRSIRVAWSVADLRGVDRPTLTEMHIALGLRGASMVAA